MKTIVYWITTILIAFAMFSGGIAYLMHQKDTMEGMARLGYPAYFVTILGVWKVLGALAILAPRFPRLKEWAYAGIFFDLTGAAASHAASGDYDAGAFHIVVPLVLAAITMDSWALRPASRKLAG
jgi:uncharacterized membrane protein YphA (DoxX/SURF4 family)